MTHDQSTHPGEGAAPPTSDVERMLEQRLGSLRQAEPAFATGLETRLLAHLEAPRGAGRFATIGQGGRRWTVAGLAAVAAGAIVVAFGAFMIGSPAPAVNAAELLQRAQATMENPMLSGVTSFHLTARVAGQMPMGGQVSSTTEQWYVAPDRTRTESREQKPDGTATVNGTLVVGQTHKGYGTPGSEGHVLSVMPMGIMWTVNDGPRGGPPGPGAQDIRVERRISLGEPQNKGEAVIAGRPVYIVEHEVAGDLASGPGGPTTRHTMWVDKATYLPLRMEQHATDGTLLFQYDVTSVAFDVAIPDTTFTALPTGTTVRDLPNLPDRPARTSAGRGPGFLLRAAVTGTVVNCGPLE